MTEDKNEINTGGAADVSLSAKKKKFRSGGVPNYPLTDNQDEDTCRGGAASPRPEDQDPSSTS